MFSNAVDSIQIFEKLAKNTFFYYKNVIDERSDYLYSRVTKQSLNNSYCLEIIFILYRIGSDVCHVHLNKIEIYIDI